MILSNNAFSIQGIFFGLSVGDTADKGFLTEFLLEWDVEARRVIGRAFLDKK